jgi:hypothetical protein
MKIEYMFKEYADMHLCVGVAFENGEEACCIYISKLLST